MDSGQSLKCVAIFVKEISTLTKEIIKEDNPERSEIEIDYKAYKITQRILKSIARKEVNNFFNVRKSV